MEYKTTLNLPSTAFPMKANLPVREPKQLAAWQQMQLYDQAQKQAPDKQSFIVHDGPPYANGPIHAGHAMNKIVKDMMCKVARLSGQAAPFVPGWDCHGLPIEINVEKKIGKAGVKVTAKEFRQACRDYAAKQVDLQREEFKRLGVLADWDNPYLTMNYSYEANTLRFLGKLLEKGFIKRGQKPIHWCPACASALAEAEVEYQQKTSDAIDVAFTVVDVKEFAQRIDAAVATDVCLPIWTTTPWTLPANQAVALHPDLDYVQVSVKENTTQLIVAEELLSTTLARYDLTLDKVVARFKGGLLEFLQLQHPFLDKKVPIVLGEHVTTEVGTGAVHTAPAHGEDDYQVALKYNLPVDSILDSRSCFLEAVPNVAGMHVFKANQPIVELLTEKGVLLSGAKLEHSYPHCWRHKTPIIFRATAQWFIKIDHDNLRENALEQISKCSWLPEWGEKRITNMVASRPDWCISRQRSWGAPIAFVVHRQTGDLHPQMSEIIDQVAQKIEQHGLQAWYDLDLSELIADADDYEKITDTLDVWFDSGVSHYCVLQMREDLNLPADVYFEGSDQHRGWFQSSLLTAVAANSAAPFKTVATHGYVVDANGHKMSKSRGNVIAPQDIINKYGADVLRLWVASSNTADDMTVSQEILQRMSDAYRRIRNTARYLLANLNDFDPAENKLPAGEMLEIDKWLCARTSDLQQQIIKQFAAHNFAAVYQLLHNFCAVDLGGFYLDVLKDRQYTTAKNSKPRRSGQTAMYHLLQAFVRWIAPILSFTADEIWACMPGDETQSVFLAKWYDLPQVCSSLPWDRILALREQINMALEQARSQGVIGGALDACVTIHADAAWQQMLTPMAEELRFLALTSDVKLAEISSKQVENKDLPGLAIAVEAYGAAKCVRCWQRREDVGASAEHPELCGRCVANISADGELRKYF